MGLHEDMLKESISELELREAILVAPETPLGSAVRQMQAKHLGGVIVIRSDGTPIGAIEEREVLKAILDSPDALDQPVADHLSSDFACLRQSDSIARLPQVMQSKRVRFVCVTDERGRATALTGSQGLMEYLAHYFAGQVMTRPGGVKPPRQREGA